MRLIALLICCLWAMACAKRGNKKGRTSPVSSNTDSGSSSSNKPNIIFVLTDDQDKLLDSMDAMPKTKKLIAEDGVTMDNFFVATPSCCVSRASIHTGMYAHNTQTIYNTYHGGCNGKYWLKSLEPEALAVSIKNAGYKTFFMGKYLNQYGAEKAGGPEHVPDGWDSWFGLTSETRYYDYNISVNGVNTYYGNTEEDYFQHQLKKHADAFIDANHDSPFFMTLAATAPHGPATPEEAYDELYTNPNISAPRNGAFNKHGYTKHWLIRQAPDSMPKSMENYIDYHHIMRWQTLASVDDVVEGVFDKLKEYNLLDNTYVLYSSDNGFHLGQYCMPLGKWQPYEWDIKVPFMMRGPGITANSTLESPVLTIDIAPTLIEIAGGSTNLKMDGKNFLPLLTSTDAVSWRTDFLIEYWGSGGSVPADCPQFGDPNLNACRPGCVCADAKNNTFSCLRTIKNNENSVYCEFDDSEQYKEFYNLKTDNYQLTNLAAALNSDGFTSDDQAAYSARLAELVACAGVDSCFKKST